MAGSCAVKRFSVVRLKVNFPNIQYPSAAQPHTMATLNSCQRLMLTLCLTCCIEVHFVRYFTVFFFLETCILHTDRKAFPRADGARLAWNPESSLITEQCDNAGTATTALNVLALSISLLPAPSHPLLIYFLPPHQGQRERERGKNWSRMVIRRMDSLGLRSLTPT